MVALLCVCDLDEPREDREGGGVQSSRRRDVRCDLLRLARVDGERRLAELDSSSLRRERNRPIRREDSALSNMIVSALITLARTIAKLTGWKVRAVPAGMWLTLKLLAVVPMFFTLNFCLRDVMLVRDHPESTTNLQRLEVSGVVGDQLRGRDDNISVNCPECVY